MYLPQAIMKLRTRFSLTLLGLALVCLSSGCAALESVAESALDSAQTSQREREYRDRGFSRESAERNAFYDQMWDSH